MTTTDTETTAPLLIHSGTVVSPSHCYPADIGIRNGRIATIGTDLTTDPDWRDAKRIDATGKYVLPGAIDVHTHFQLPVRGTVSADDFGTGSRAAAAGGVTTFIDFATPEPGQALPEAITDRRAEADAKVVIDYSLHGVIAEFDRDRFEELPAVIASGVPTFKMYMVYRKEGWMADDGALYRALRTVTPHGGMLMVHAENVFMIDRFIAEAVARGDLGCEMHAQTRPNFTEAEAVARAINIASYARGALYIVHLSTREALAELQAGRARGVNVHAETCPHFLELTNALYSRDDGVNFTTCPPVRTDADRTALWAALVNRDIDVLSTDHCSFTTEQKSTWDGDFRAIQFGMPGIETLLPLAYSDGVDAGRFTLSRLVELLAAAPARLFGLDHRKGAIRVGMDADIAILDPTAQRTIRADEQVTNIDYSPYEGRVLNGAVTTTISRGEVVYDGEQVTGAPGRGRFIKRTRDRSLMRPANAHGPSG